MTKRTPLELLAPARDLECGIAAVNHGADAVYIGAPKFGARAAAGNSLKDIAGLVAYAHRYWARVYITLNTILFEHELEEAAALAREVYEAGADALIVQDMALLELGLPPIPLIASTQTHNYAIDRIQFLERVGIERVILARELSLDQLRAIRAATSLELEFFVHGALCVSFSGQCYFSHALTGRSANRGECAQVCRLPYTLVDGRGSVLARNQHLLSLKDLDLSAYLADLADAGVTSFKIEGRLKDAAYVKNITSFYRGKLDAIIEGRDARRASSGTTTVPFVPDPEKTFHRGATTYFLMGRRKAIGEARTPKSIGRKIGTVRSVRSDSFVLDSTEPVHSGDGICFFDEKDELRGTNVNQAAGGRITPNSMEGIQQGTVVYRNFDRAFVQMLQAHSARRKISVRFVFREATDGFTLQATDEDGVEAESSFVHPKEEAVNPPAAGEALRIQFSKLGETNYALRELQIEWTRCWFIPIGLLNRLRRDCIAALDVARLRAYPRRTQVIVPNDTPYPATALDHTANVVNTKARQFYLRHGVREIEEGLELQSSAAGAVLMTTRHCLKYQFGLCQGGRDEAEELYLFDGRTKYKLEFDCDQCVMKIVAP